MGIDVRVDVDRHENGGTFTNYDLIHGVVRLTTTTSISLTFIQVKLEGIATTQLTVPRVLKKKNQKENRDKLLQDVHKVLYDSLIVFPPENVRNVSSSKEFTLTPGDYTYPFQFKIPLNNSCVKTSGISNKVSFSRDNRQILVNNGNFNTNLIKNVAQNYFQAYPNTPSSLPDGQKMQNYHVTTQLPPSISDMGSFASVRYFVKVTCKRSSVFKANLRAFDPFTFLPLDLDSHNRPLFEGQQFEEFREVFFRKEMVFKNRIPEIVGIKVSKRAAADCKKALPSTPPLPQRKSIFSSFLGGGTSSPPTPPTRPASSSRRSSSSNTSLRHTSAAYEINASNVPFSFEVRFKYRPYLVPSHLPTFKLFLLSPQNPSRYSLAQYGYPDESNGLGVIYFQKLTVELRSTTNISVVETDGAGDVTHHGKSEDVIQLCNNTYQNLQFDLHDAKTSRSSSATSSSYVDTNMHELEIPRKYFDNCVVPGDLAPSFKTCNITRKYSLVIVGGFSSERISDFKDRAEVEKKVRYVDLFCSDVQVLSGLKLTSWLHSNASESNVSRTSDSKPALPERPSSKTRPSDDAHSSSSKDGESRLPTYDDVVRESSYQDDGEHLRARRRYQN
ncbi:hypothetical protein CJI97_001052 [Candidozyma auris]|nr:hypothetical protein CJI97_001052 [[Candida] auris]